MASLKDLRKRVQVVKSTKKITSAMKLVATSYMKKAEERYRASLNYYKGAGLAASRVLENVAWFDLKSVSPFLTPRKGNRHLIIMISADRGLCGGFNGNIGRYTSKHIENLKNQGKDIKLFCVGKKAVGSLKETHKPLIQTVAPAPTENHFHEISLMVQDILNQFKEGKFDTCDLVYNQFKSILACLPVAVPFLPLETPSLEGQAPLYEMDPATDESIEYVLTKYLTALLYKGVMDSQISEQSSRMMAMDNASRNAEDLITKLELQYNRTRQTIITSELIEIISGAEAL